MEHTKEYFDILEKVRGRRPVKRRVFVASDDPGVILEARTNYSEPEWTILGSTEVAESAAENKRFHVAGLTGIIKDVFALAACDYLVCTFSSQICRLAYELMQSRHADASGRFVSLDDSYYYGGGNDVIEIAATSHIPRNDQEIELKVGDRIHVYGNHWNGLSKGENLRISKRGLYPSYKGTKLIQKVPFPKTKWWLPTMAT
jgi:glycoprotein 6-alpha-L-fucosyltransferase